PPTDMHDRGYRPRCRGYESECDQQNWWLHATTASHFLFPLNVPIVVGESLSRSAVRHGRASGNSAHLFDSDRRDAKAAPNVDLDAAPYSGRGLEVELRRQFEP